MNIDREILRSARAAVFGAFMQWTPKEFIQAAINDQEILEEIIKLFREGSKEYLKSVEDKKQIINPKDLLTT